MSKTSSKATFEGPNPPQIAGKVRKLAFIKDLYSNLYSIEDLK